MNTIGMICQREVVCTGPETTVQAAAKLMRTHHVGSLVIVALQDGRRRPVGIVTDRDLVIEVIALDLEPHVLTVGDIALPGLVTVWEGEALQVAADIMSNDCIRRLPVVSDSGDLVGIVSFDDLLAALTMQLSEMTVVLGRGREQTLTAG